MHYGSQEKDEEEWRVQNYEVRCHHHHQPKKSMSYVKLPSFSGDSDPNVYLRCKAKVEQIFSVYVVEEDQRVKLASLEFEDYAMNWWHKIVMDIGLNKRQTGGVI